MRLQDIVETSAAVAGTRSRKKKTAALSDLIGRLEERHVGIAVHYLMGTLSQGKIGLGHAIVHAVLQEIPDQEGEPLTLDDVHATFDTIRDTSGAGSTKRRRELLGALVLRATPDERSFLGRLIVGELRQGALAGVMAEAVAAAAGLPPTTVRRAAMFAGDLAAVAEAALLEGAEALERFRLELFRPLEPMLAQTAETPAIALEQLGRAAFELKLDGARIQVHKDGEIVRVYSRRGREVTHAVPEVVELMGELDAPTLLLDGEVLAFHPDGRPRPFQVTMRRFGRKLDVEALREELPLTPVFFDCLHADGEDLLDHSGEDRAAALARWLPAANVIRRLTTDDAEVAAGFFEEALADGHEGVMAKSVEAPYEAGSRGSSWLKIKPAHTLDLVVLAVEWGSGRRRGKLSNIHLGARDGDDFVMLGKTFKGMTDELLDWQTRRFLELEVRRDDYTVYVRPEVVVEIAFNDIQESPHYPAGLALRFARVKAYREDKRPEDADTVETVRSFVRT